MAVPDFQSLMLPVLHAVRDGKTHKSADIGLAVAKALSLTDADLAELLPSGKQTTFANRCAWAKVYLAQAGLLQRLQRGYYELTDRGHEALVSGLDRITIGYLTQYPEFVAFRDHARRQNKETDKEQNGEPEPTPSELMEMGHAALHAELADEVLRQAKSCSPAFFEQLVVDLLVAMGYGGSRADAGRAIGRSGDGGIDGIIKEDRLGLGAIYIQAKRWDATVGRPVLQAFAGSLEGQRARRGVFITTSGFSREAEDYADRIEKKIVLIDGPRLADLMIEYGVGVAEVTSYTVKRLDTDYFESSDI